MVNEDELLNVYEVSKSVRITSDLIVFLMSVNRLDLLDKRKELINIFQNIEILFKKFLLSEGVLTKSSRDYFSHDLNRLYKLVNKCESYKKYFYNLGLGSSVFESIELFVTLDFIGLRYKQNSMKFTSTISFDNVVLYTRAFLELCSSLYIY